jgi:hypothetical protein
MECNQRIPDSKNMTRHQEFLTDEFLLYAAECKRMAAIARPPRSNAAKIGVTLPAWTDLLSHLAARHTQPQENYSRFGGEPAYS